MNLKFLVSWPPYKFAEAAFMQASKTCCVFSAHIGQSSFSLPEKNLVGKITPHPRVLRRRVAKFHRVGVRRTFHVAGNNEIFSIHLQRRFVAVERMDEIRQEQPAVLAADVNPLLLGGAK